MPRSVREQVILRVAGQVFAEGGYERASMDRIAGLAGVSKPMLYAYFDSKEGLYIAYIERTGGELVQRLVSADRADGAHPPTGRLRAVINEFLAFVEEHSDGWTVLFRELSARRPLAEQVARLRSEIVGEVQRMLEGAGRLVVGGPEATRVRGRGRGDRRSGRGAGQLVAQETRRPARGRRRVVRGPGPGGDLDRGPRRRLNPSGAATPRSGPPR